MANCTSYARDIKPLFRQEDVDHMKTMDVHLDDYNWLSDPQGGSRKCGDQQKDYPDHANARWVQQALTGACGTRMPKGGPTGAISSWRVINRGWTVGSRRKKVLLKTGDISWMPPRYSLKTI